MEAAGRRRLVLVLLLLLEARAGAGSQQVRRGGARQLLLLLVGSGEGLAAGRRRLAGVRCSVQAEPESECIGMSGRGRRRREETQRG